MELNGVLVMGESEDYDIALGVGAWHVGGGRNGKWMADDAMMNQTTLVMVPRNKQGNTSRCYGLWPDLSKTTRAGYEQRCWAEGTITVKGKVYTLENAYGIHDQMTFGHSYDHMELIREPYTYIWCLSGSVQIFFFGMPKAGVSYGRVYLDELEIPFSHNEITLDEQELWTDPETGMQVPVRWHVNMNSAGAVADINVAAGGRGIYCVVNKKGYNMRYGFSARTSGSVTLPDGRSVPIPNIMSYVEWGRTVMSLESGAP